MPRVSDFVSDSVWRVPNDTSLRMSDSMRSADGAVPMSCSSACVAGGAVGASAETTAGAARQAERLARGRVRLRGLRSKGQAYTYALSAMDGFVGGAGLALPRLLRPPRPEGRR